jgi:predicted ATPase/DNA-binding CsgD family transcriptional regulator
MQGPDIISIPHSEQARMHNLPAQPTQLFGREEEVRAVRDLLRDPHVRMVTLTGPAGVGKTRLALASAEQLLEDFPDGVFFVPLALLRDAELVAAAIAQEFELKEREHQPPPALLQAYLLGKHLLLLLDNFEQVLPARLFVSGLLESCPKLKILITSREVLNVRAEHLFPVSPLALPDPAHVTDWCEIGHVTDGRDKSGPYAAIMLFVLRAQAARPGFSLTPENIQTVAEICHRLDGLPLSLELAAARIKLLSPQSLLARLEHRLQVLTQGHSDLPERQQTLRTTIQWSYDLLNPQEQRLFQWLSVFAGGCTFEAIEALYRAVGEKTETLLDTAISLVDKSLLQQVDGPEPRLHMLETIREFGLDALANSGKEDLIRHAHAAYFVALAEQAEPELEGPRQAIWLATLDAEYPNMRAVFKWALEPSIEGTDTDERHALALRLGGALRRFWIIRGYLSEGQAWLEQALAGKEDAGDAARPVESRPDGLSPSTISSHRAKALMAATALASMQGNFSRAKVLGRQALDLYRKLEDARAIASALYLLGGIAWTEGDLAQARVLAEEALEFARKSGKQGSLAWALFRLARLLTEQGEYARGTALLEESLAMHRATGNKRGIASSLYHLAFILFLTLDDPAKARSLLDESLMLFKEVGDKEGIAFSLYLSGRLALRQHNRNAARSLFEEGEALFREMGHREGLAWMYVAYALLALEAGDNAAAQARYEQAESIARELHHRVLLVTCLEVLAGITGPRDPLQAARLWGTAEALRQGLGVPLPPIEKAAIDRSIALARTQTDRNAFAVAWAEGRAASPEYSPRQQGQVRTETNLSTTPQFSPPAAGTLIDTLTPRESEVLRLLAAGLTSNQIAQRLTLSILTVNTHIRSIYSKLGVSSRSAATRYAIEHKLV